MPLPMAQQSNPLQLDFCGVSMDSPIVLLSGCVGFGEEYTRVEGFSNRDVGAVVLKGTTGDPRLGNPPHRVYETPMGMLNAIGLQNPGVEAWRSQKLPALLNSGARVVASIWGRTIDEYAEAAEETARQLGLAPEERPYRPHLSVARCRPQ